MIRLLLTAMCALPLLMACGGGTELDISDNVPTGSPPLVFDVSPNTAAVGDQVLVSGIGYSIVPAENIIHFGDTAVVAETYALLDPPQNNAVEQLTFTMPTDADIGDHLLLLTVDGEPSNADTDFTVTP